MSTRVSDAALDVLFRRARTYSTWLDRAVPDELLRDVYDLMKWGSTEREGVCQEYSPGRLRSNFLCNLGYGDPAGLHPRLPRLDFGEACKLL